MTTDTLKSYQAARQQQRADTLAEYRKLVGLLVSDGADTAALDAADALFARLNISDAVLAGDVDALREYRGHEQELAKFEQAKPEIDKKIDDLTQQIAKVRDDMVTADSRLARLQAERHKVGSPYNKMRYREGRLAELKQQNPRVFGPL